MATRREIHPAMLLPDGQVLAAGGDNSTGSLSSAELYNPATGTWTQTGSMNVARAGFTAPLLQAGQGLVAGGASNGTANAGPSAQLSTPATATSTTTGSA